jgi:hypothetical protein
MSKKLIAVASAAALALTGLVGIAPASATPASIAYTVAGSVSTGGSTAAAPFEIPVPQTNSLEAANVVEIAITGVKLGDTMTVTVTSGPAKVTKGLHTASGLVNVSTLGAASQTTTISNSDTDEDFFVYTTSTSVVSTISISITETDGSTKSTTSATKYVEGTSSATDSTGNVYKLKNLVAPASLAIGVEGEVTFNVTDAFDNVLETPTIAGAITASGQTLSNSGVATWDSIRKLHVAKLTSTTTDPFVINVDTNGSGRTNSQASVSGLGTAVTEAVLVVNSPAVASANTSLTAQVAALTAQLAESRPKATSVTKKRYNTLARKWNAAFPSQKVALKQ